MFKGVIDAIDTIDAYFLFSGKIPPDSAGIRIFDNFFKKILLLLLLFLGVGCVLVPKYQCVRT